MSDKSNKRAVILLSGGIDSATCLALASRDSYMLYALSLDYGQRHRIELEFAQKIAAQIGVEKHLVLTLDLRQIGGSALTDTFPVPKDRPMSDMNNDIPVTYVPARNTIFLSMALAWAETLNARTIFIGANAVDFSGYPDCRPEYLSAFEKMATLATKIGVQKGGIQIKAPLINMSKSEIIRLGHDLGVDFKLTTSCYDPSPNGNACGRCDSCQIRRKGFTEAGIADPTRQAAETELH